MIAHVVGTRRSVGVFPRRLAVVAALPVLGSTSGHDGGVLERISWIHHALVGGAVVGCGALAYVGLIGEPSPEERFESKQVVVSPAGGDALRIREVIDVDFGGAARRGLERDVPTDFGVPTDVTVHSDTAPDDLTVIPMSGEVRFRIGDPDVTNTGQHRYVIEFTLPEARVTEGQLALDIIGNDEELGTGRFEVVVAGLELRDPRCNTGRAGAAGGCDLVADGDVYRAVIDPLRPGAGVTIGGDIVGRVDVATPPLPPLPERRPEPDRTWLALALLPIGAASAAGSYVVSARRGRNEVYAGGAADAAFGALPAPGSDPSGAPPTRLVTDRRLGELATVEFAPPVGLEPWEAAVLLRERIDDETVRAWFSGLAGRDVIVLETTGTDLTMAWGSRRADLDEQTEQLLATVVPAEGTYRFGSYDEALARVWSVVRARQGDRIAASGWWKHQPPSTGGGTPWYAFGVVALMLAFGFGTVIVAALAALTNAWLAAAFTVVVIAVIAHLAYSSLRPARSAAGSALALRAESFRRFLDASEGQHVQWAWERGVLREYTAWAVALGAAEAWSRALRASDLPAETRTASTTPLLLHSMGRSVSSAHTKPSSSGSSGGGGGSFSGGRVGGGGGGGRSGTW